ncbi:MAG: hypothetical protein M1823_003302 [Watsoniomyces obsoletus]|nr:MAG: hypothetical protein M1823_003302 [Watsoniomyces obsoletus]
MLSLGPYDRLPDDDQASGASSYTLSSLEAHLDSGIIGKAWVNNLFPLKRRPTDGSPPRPRSWFPVWWTRRFSGWRGGTATYTVLIMAVLLLNITFTVWAAVRFGASEGIGTMYSGDCKTTRRLSSGLHLLINILGSAMLGGSNYCMQRLSAPTREEVDKAHAAGTWLDIGIPSVRNVWRISRQRRNIWILLALSSVPLHLLYNSAVFPQLSAVDYSVIAISEDVLRGGAFNRSNPFSSLTTIEMLYWARNYTSALEPLPIRECVQAYSSELVSDRGLSLLILRDFKEKTVYEFATSTDRMVTCGGPSHKINEPKINECYDANKDRIRSRYHTSPDFAARCLSQRVEEQCRLQFSVVILLVVIACNLIKLGCLLWTTMRINQPALVTLGDAISSFLQEPDPVTRGYCMASKNQLERGIRIEGGKPQRWDARRRFWGATISWQRWLIFLSLCTIALVTASILLNMGLGRAPAKWWKEGFGDINPDMLVGIYVNDAVVNTIIANSPQLIFSILYLLHNAIVTAQLVGQEWSSFSRPSSRLSRLSRRLGRPSSPPRRIPLRVTVAQGRQTSTYYLGIPYIYGLPFMIFSILLHWLISRSIFLVNVKFFDYLQREDSRKSINRCGFSVPAIFVSIILSALLVVAIILLGLRRYPKGIPLAGTCSLVISAACHVPEEERKECPDLAYRPLRWGVTIEPKERFDPDDVDSGLVKEDGMEEVVKGVGHCSFTHRDDVALPTREGWYMGSSSSSLSRACMNQRK